MSKEILEFSVQVDEKFDLKFNWLDGFWGAAFKFFVKIIFQNQFCAVSWLTDHKFLRLIFFKFFPNEVSLNPDYLYSF
uniref:hypothetical protein n=1 Tax=Pedobacter agri TaxID=454586 RepID=UPI00029B19E7|nr:hypothetical protein [Pedobacter agri]